MNLHIIPRRKRERTAVVFTLACFVALESCTHTGQTPNRAYARAEAPADSGWQQTFFRDNTLTTSCGMRSESDAYMFRDSDGGWAPPAGCPAAQAEWSVRMDRTNVFFQGGSYEFGLFYDDGARVYVDGALVVDGWSATQHYESRVLTAGEHTLRLEYKNNGGHAIVQLWWRGPGALPFNTDVKDPNQWWVNYWGNPNQWQDGVGQRNEGSAPLNRDFGNTSPGYGVPSDYYSLRFERSVNFECGVQRFHVVADDGYRLYVDGILRQDRWIPSTWDDMIDVSLSAGAYTLQLDYFKTTGNAHVSLDWSLVSACPVAPVPLAIVKTASQESVAPGQAVQFTVSVTASLAGTLNITDALPVGLSYQPGSGSAGVSYDVGRRAVFYSAVVRSGDIVSMTYQARVDDDVRPGSFLPTRATTSVATDTASTLLTLAVPKAVFNKTLVLIYAAGDNDLSEDMLALLNYAERASNNANATVLMLLDGPSTQDARLYHLNKDDDPTCPNYTHLTCQGRYVEGRDTWAWTDDVSTITSLAEFIHSGVTSYPNAQKVIVSIVGHGESWVPDLPKGEPSRGGEGGKPGGLLADVRPLRSLSTRDLNRALQQGLQGTNRRIDLLFLDSCLMASVETVFEMRDKVDWVLASQSWSWTAFPYDAYIDGIDDVRNSRQIGELWLQQSVSSALDYQLPYAFSLINMSKLDVVSAAVDQLGVALSATLPSKRDAIIGAFSAAAGFDSSQDGYIAVDDETRDLASIGREVKSRLADSAVSQAADALLGALGNAVVMEAHGAGIPARYSSQEWRWSTLGGLSIFAPGAADSWKRRYYVASQLVFEAQAHWGTFINALWNTTPPESSKECETAHPDKCEGAEPLAIPQIALDTRGGRDSVLLRWRVTGNLTRFAHFNVERAAAGSSTFALLTSGQASQHADRRPEIQSAPIDYCYRVVAVDVTGLGSVASNTACATLGQLGLWVPHQVAPPGAAEIAVPINVDNGDGLCASAMGIVVRYDKGVVAPTGTITPSAYASGYAFKLGTHVPGEVRITHLGECKALFGSGTLFTLGFRMLGSEGQVSPMEFITSIGNTEVVDKREPLKAVPLRTQNGSLTVRSLYVRGDVDGSGAVTPIDASGALAIAAGARIPLPSELSACEVTGDGRCTAADASVILCYFRDGSWDVCSLSAAANASRRVWDMAHTASPAINICARPPEPMPDGTQSVAIDVQNAGGIASADVAVLFDATAAMFVSASPGETGATVAFNTRNSGIVRVSLTRADAHVDATDLRAATIRFKPSQPQSALGISVRVVTAAFADDAGRDMVESELQRAVVVGSCLPRQLTQLTTYLPLTMR